MNACPLICTDKGERPGRKIVVAMDSFKGCLTTFQANRAVAEGVRKALPGCDVVCIPVADGGEGLLDVLVPDDAQRVCVRVHGPMDGFVDACYGILHNDAGQTAYIEMARICGLPLVPLSGRNPMYATSYGLGEVIADALGRGCRNVVVGLGGSATNDGGTGMLQALGFRFFDVEGRLIDAPLCGRLLADIYAVDDAGVQPFLHETQFTAVCDVRSPFLGLDGATMVFAPQKGADAAMVRRLEQSMSHWARIAETETGCEFVRIPGSGAAGGVGGAMCAFLHAELKPGVQAVLQACGLDKELQDASLAFTGEGKSDVQTLMGKVPMGVLHLAQNHGVPVVLLSGCVEDVGELVNAGFLCSFASLSAPLTLLQAMNPDVAECNLTRTAEQICRAVFWENSQT